VIGRLWHAVAHRRWNKPADCTWCVERDFYQVAVRIAEHGVGSKHDWGNPFSGPWSPYELPATVQAAGFRRCSTALPGTGAMCLCAYPCDNMVIRIIREG
jgi:hypothetical protein